MHSIVLKMNFTNFDILNNCAIKFEPPIGHEWFDECWNVIVTQSCHVEQHVHFGYAKGPILVMQIDHFRCSNIAC
jgi:hypothetical protein